MLLKAIRSLLSLFAASALLSACGGGGDTPVATYTVSGTVTGNTGAVTLTNNNGDSKTVASGGGTFTFTAQNSGTAYSVATTQPTGQTCTITGGSGSVTAAVTNVTVTCVTNTYTVSGTVTGNNAAVTLTNNNGDTKTVASGGGAFTFTAQNYGSSYSVATTQPTGQTCLLTGASGTITATATVVVSCTNNTYTVQGSITGLTASGLSLSLTGTQTETVSPTANSNTYNFTKTLNYGNSYTVQVATPPTGLACSITSVDSGTVGTTDVVVNAECHSSIQIQAIDGSPMSFAEITVTSLVDGKIASCVVSVDGTCNISINSIIFPAKVKAQGANNGPLVYWGYIEKNTQPHIAVNALSTLIVSIGCKCNPRTLITPISTDALKTAKDYIKIIFGSVFNQLLVGDSVIKGNLLAVDFPPDHTGLDLFFDSMKVWFDLSGNPTVCTKISNICKTFDLMNLNDVPFDVSGDEISKLNQVPYKDCVSVFSGITTGSLATNATLYAEDFFDSGINADQYRAAINSRYGSTPGKLFNFKFVGRDSNGNYKFQSGIFSEGDNARLGRFATSFKVANGKCVMVGDQMPFGVGITTRIFQQTRVDSVTDSASTLSPVSGFEAMIGVNDFFGNFIANFSLPDDMGVSQPVKTVRYTLCDSYGSCGKPIFDMVRFDGLTKHWFYKSGTTLSAPFVSFSSLGIDSPDLYYNGNPLPIQVEFISDSNVSLKKARLQMEFGFINPTDASKIKLPEVIDAQQAFNTMTSGTTTLNIKVPENQWTFGILSTSSGSYQRNSFMGDSFNFSSLEQTFNVNFNGSFLTKDSVRQLVLKGNTIDGTMYERVYLYAPGCTNNCGTN